MLTKHQTKKLRKFSQSLNESEAGDLIQETTDILNNMFKTVQPSNQTSNRKYFEKFSKHFVSILMDSKIQITFFFFIFRRRVNSFTTLFK